MSNDSRVCIPPPPTAYTGDIHPEVIEAGVVASSLADSAAHTRDANGRMSPHTKRAYRVAYVFGAMRAKELELEQARAAHTEELIVMLERLLREANAVKPTNVGRRIGDRN